MSPLPVEFPCGAESGQNPVESLGSLVSPTGLDDRVFSMGGTPTRDHATGYENHETVVLGDNALAHCKDLSFNKTPIGQ